MADISDCETALVAVAASALYPNGTGSASAVGTACKIFRGWPTSANLTADIKAGTANVSVFAQPGTVRNVTRYSAEWQTTQAATTTFTATVSGSTVIIGGTGGATQLVGIKSNNTPCIYQTSPTDTTATVAASLAALISGATASGSVITLPGNPSVVARVQGFAVIGQEVRRQCQRVMVSCWCSSPAQRDAVAKVVDAALAVYDGGFLPLSDGTGGKLTYRNDYTTDGPSKDALWRRDLVYDIEYPTVVIQSAPPLMWPETIFTKADGTVIVDVIT